MVLMAAVTPLTWESNFFALRTGILDFRQSSPLNIAQFQAFDVVQARTDASQSAEMDALSALGFQLIEGEAELQFTVGAGERPADIRIARESHIAALRQMASEVFVYSRFRPPWFAEDAGARFYAQWIENAVKGHFDHLCLMAVDSQHGLQGFVSLRETGDGEARIGLLATCPASRRNGVGIRLLSAAQDWCRARRLKTLRVTTQLANMPALRLYLRCGATLERTSYWFYRSSHDSL
ncbi:dTDP-4-amino-4,6-dideoxy-D-galactose acyltransferase [Enterobacteriaceae bacterium LUAb1]